MLNPASISSLKASTQMRDLTCALASVNRKIKYYLGCAASTYYSTKDDFEKELTYFSTLELTAHDKLAAAAAVGDQTKVRAYLTEVTNLMSWVNFGFCSPVQAAASTGKTECLAILLDHAAQDMPATRTTSQKSHRDASTSVRKGIQIAMENGHASCAALLMDFQHKWDLLREMRETGSLGRPHLFRAAEAGCIDLFKDLMGPDAHGSSYAHDRDLHDAALVALENCHTNIIRYLLETKVMAPTMVPGNRSGVSTPPLGLAVMSGNRAIVDLLLSFGAPLDSQILIWAIKQSKPQETSTPDMKCTHPERPIYHIVKHLIAIGTVVDRTSMSACAPRAMRIVCSYCDGGQHKYRLTDGVRVIIRMCHETMKKYSRTPSVVPGHVKMVLKLVLGGKLIVEKSFQDMAKEVVDWLAAKAKP
jgi:hypothetical protein